MYYTITRFKEKIRRLTTKLLDTEAAKPAINFSTGLWGPTQKSSNPGPKDRLSRPLLKYHFLPHPSFPNPMHSSGFLGNEGLGLG
ncbi:unnamed protein product [Gordionus sp. m RMFG-2023]